ncbi:hypothetical protein TRVL_09966 [Trypanosoma vivax]|nr:hypothetical protein TRVL_09966 [Trypanosoma vivax]
MSGGTKQLCLDFRASGVIGALATLLMTLPLTARTADDNWICKLRDGGGDTWSCTKVVAREGNGSYSFTGCRKGGVDRDERGHSGNFTNCTKEVDGQEALLCNMMGNGTETWYGNYSCIKDSREAEKKRAEGRGSTNGNEGDNGNKRYDRNKGKDTDAKETDVNEVGGVLERGTEVLAATKGTQGPADPKEGQGPIGQKDANFVPTAGSFSIPLAIVGNFVLRYALIGFLLGEEPIY